MAELSYHYRKKRKFKTKWRWALLFFVILVIGVAGAIGYDVYRGQSKAQTGEAKLSQLSYDSKGPWLKISEPTFTMQLPGDWREVNRIDSEYERGITWQSTKPKEDNRYLTLYIDKISKTKAVNKLLPIEAVGNKIRHGQISENCASYTQGGSFNAADALKAKEMPAKWEEVTFMCDLPKVFDNVVGTSSKEGINTLTVEGKTTGKHSYFFVYTDHNVQPNYDILTDVIESFEAK